MKAAGDDGYDCLRAVLARAVEQASAGKGRERHASDGEAFDEQQIVKLGVWTAGPGFAIGQACKKALESTRLPEQRAVAELLGAINYLAAAVIVVERGAHMAHHSPHVLAALTRARELGGLIDMNAFPDLVVKKAAELHRALDAVGA